MRWSHSIAGKCVCSMIDHSLLSETTFTAADQDEVTKTLQFIRRKIKNETAEQRQDALSSLIAEANSKGGIQACYFVVRTVT